MSTDLELWWHERLVSLCGAPDPGGFVEKPAQPGHRDLDDSGIVSCHGFHPFMKGLCPVEVWWFGRLPAVFQSEGVA